MFDLMIVDDEYEIRYGLQHYFPWQELGFNIVGAFASGAEALAYIKGNHVDVLLTDIRMPEISGIDLIKASLEIIPHLRCIVISGYRDFDYAKQCMALGVRDYIIKPTKYEELEAVFQKVAEELKASQFFTPSLDSTNLPVIEQVKLYIRSHIKEASLETAASQVGLNPFYLSTFFHQQTGKKFYDYLLAIRMGTASKLLLTTMTPIQEISRETGSMNANSFARAFREYYGMSPKVYRAQQGR